MALPRSIRLLIPALAIGALFAANRFMDRVEATDGGASPGADAALPPQPVAFGRPSFEAPMTLVSKPVSDAVRGRWLPPFEGVDAYGAFADGFAVNAVWARGATDSSAIDARQVATTMAQGLDANGGRFTQVGGEPVRVGARTGYRVRGTFTGPNGNGNVEIVTLRAADELLSVVLLGPAARVQGGADHLVKTLAAR